jgi:glycosyltransferase involved in cell wall biosynthesis
MVALEAAERGRAAIVTNVGGLPEIVADGETGLVVEPEGLAAAIVELARDPARVRAMGAAARARALRRFSPEAAVEGVERVYGEQHE